MGNHFVKDMDSAWHWLNECHMGSDFCKPQNLQNLANNMNDSSMLNQYGSTDGEESTSSNEDAYSWNRMQNALPTPSLKLPHLYSAEEPQNNESSYDTALGDDRIGKMSFIHY